MSHALMNALNWHLAPPDVPDREVVGHFLTDRDLGVSKADNQYRWWSWIGSAFRPKTYLEIGVFTGYTVAGLLHGGAPLNLYAAFDREMDESEGCLGRVGDVLSSHYPGVVYLPTHCDTQKVDVLTSKGEFFDLVHVDGDHHGPACHHDMLLAWAALKPGGVMAVDDLHSCLIRTLDDHNPAGDMGVTVAVSAFLKRHGLPLVWLPSRTATGLIMKPGEPEPSCGVGEAAVRLLPPRCGLQDPARLRPLLDQAVKEAYQQGLADGRRYGGLS